MRWTARVCLAERGAVAGRPGRSGPAGLRAGRAQNREVVAVVESMNGASFVHDQLELAGFEVEIADAQRVKGDRRRLLARPTVSMPGCWPSWPAAISLPAVWLPDPAVRASASGPASFAFGQPAHGAQAPGARHPDCARAPLPGLRPVRHSGRALLSRLEIPQPWQGTLRPACA